MANPIVINEGGHYAYTITGPYHVKDVLPPRPFHEVGPGIDRVRSLPAVEVVVGNVSVSYRNFFKNNSLYVSAYPVVQFREEASIYVPSLTIYVTVDPDRGKVLDSMVAVNTPVLERPGNAS